MSGIQRYSIDSHQPESDGYWVTYVDHVAAIAEATQQAHERAEEYWQSVIAEAYEQGAVAGVREMATIRPWRDNDQVAHYRQGYEQGQRDVFALHAEWTVTGMCKPDCLPCRRLDELYAERVAGAKEGQRDAIAKAIAAVKALPWHRPWGSDDSYEYLVGDEVIAAIQAVDYE